ncbi:MAG: DUF3320 domain-containing protein, partial [Actinomycetota bacterium]|nr:DUF3320 domain-containing protein [Actinomycetota bacterium]
LQGRPERVEAPAEPGTPVPPRVQQWKNALLDLSLRNRLINFTERYAVALTAPEGRIGAVEDVIHDGRSLTLLPSDAVTEVHRARGVRFGRDLPQEQLVDQLDRGAGLFTDVTQAAYATRLRNLAHRARTVVEETGANNLYLALGSLAWSLDERPLRSPLILVPVQLVAQGRGERTTYRLRLDESGGSTPNYCLLEKLKATHGLQVPDLAEPKEDLSGIDLEGTLRAVRRALAAKGLPFHVEDTAHLAILQFAKFRLWKDLAEQWQILLANPLAAHLAHTPTEPFADPVPPPEQVDLDALAADCPIPADGSQLTSIADAVHGTTFVLEGPPGTGKSQTITNLLARAVAEGRRVLFVAEKRAALDVVKTRMDAIGMGPFSLDLHDKGSKPTVVRQQIKAALDHRVTVDRQGLQAAREELRASTRTLSRYAARLHEHNGAGLSLYSAHTGLLTLGEDVPALPVPPALLSTAVAPQVAAIRALLRTVAEVADPARPGPRHPWGFVGLDEVPEQALPRIRELAGTIDGCMRSLPTAGRLGTAVRAAGSGPDLSALARLGGSNGMPLGLLDEIRTARWQRATAALQGEVQAFADTAHPGLEAATPAALDLPVSGLHAQAQAAAASSWWGRKKRLRAVLEQLRPGLTDGAEVAPKQVPELTAALVRVHGEARALAGRASVIPGVQLPASWNPLTEAGRQVLDGQLQWLGWAGGRVDPAGSGGRRATFTVALRDLLASGERADPGQLQVLSDCAAAVEELTALCRSTPAQLSAWSGAAGLVARWQESERMRDGANPELGSLRRWVALRRHLRPLLDNGMTQAHGLLLSGEVDADDAVRALDRGLAEASVRERHTESGLEGFDAAAHERSITRFTRASDGVRRLLPDALQEQVVGARPFATGTTMGRIVALQRELDKRRGGLAVRPLLQAYGELIVQLMPCVLVSPDSLARFFPVQAGLFDIVVFDEASQIRVADAIGAIGRASSVVVVGDSKQMPPTSFAEPTITTDDEEELAGAVPAVEDEESILSECVQARVRRHWLSWHYRSQDESLIAFSNQHYYEGRLSSFPAPTTGTADPGVDGHGINLVRVEGTFHRSGRGKLLRTNPVEADAIVADLVRRFDAHQGEGFPSVGVVTFNQQQRAHIEGLVRDHQDPRLAESLDSTQEEGLFIKNLENVQGDERDAILFSTAFSVNERGVLPLNFGPLNRAGGERRLNVAVTRARRQVVLYSSFDPAQLRAEETTSVGIQHLRAYLDLAANGTRSMEEAVRRSGPVDRHREAVAQALRDRGLVVATDVGLSDFRIDLSISLAREPERRVLAVILDGPGWARRRTVGDRDGLPGQVLGEMLRWPGVARIWLPAWLSDPEQVLEQVGRQVHAAAAGTSTEAAPVHVPEPVPDGSPDRAAYLPLTASQEGVAAGADRPHLPSSGSGDQLAPPERATPPAVADVRLAHEADFRPWVPGLHGSRSVLDELPAPRAAAQVRDVLIEAAAAEGPVHEARLAKIVAEAFDLSRVSADRARSILQCLPPGSRCAAEPPFVWIREEPYQEWGGFRRDQQSRRPIEHVALREIANAMRALCAATGGMEQDELLRESLAVFGGRRMTAKVLARMEHAAAFAERHGHISRGQRGEWRAGSSDTAAGSGSQA